MIHHKIFSGSLVALLCIWLALPAMSQQQGNIVEYFGKERVETTQEGFIIHQFHEGYALRQAVRSGVLFTGQDLLGWQLAQGVFRSPAQQPEFSMLSEGIPQNFRWQPIQADSVEVFREDMRQAFLYTAYEAGQSEIVLLNAAGHTQLYVNGQPREGDHYDYGYTLIPLRLQKGLNEFIYTPGRFGRVTARLIKPHQAVMLSTSDLTLPSVIRQEQQAVWGGIRLINASEQTLRALTITCILESGEQASYATQNVMPLTVRKLPFRIPALLHDWSQEEIRASVVVSDSRGRELDRKDIVLKVRNRNQHHERTFISNIDGSVQYYSVAPSTSEAQGQAFVLSVHGASVEATNQARAYRQKDWAHIVAPTNRRPFGFNWEEWGRMDALEVLAHAREIFQTDPQQTYLTGHSMGGHGSWFLGATYPDQFAAIAPCAGYPDIIGYRRGFSDESLRQNPHYQMIYRAAHPGRVLKLTDNYLQSGVYVLHGDADEVVPVEQARMMREKLGTFHPNFGYYEYPGGSHWYGDHSMDWPPLFDFLRQNSIPEMNQVEQLQFTTASPGVSARNYWLRINQQVQPLAFSHANLNWTGDTLVGQFENVAHLSLLLSKLHKTTPVTLLLDGQSFKVDPAKDVHFARHYQQWQLDQAPRAEQKNPQRNGGFKMAFDHKAVLVYPTGGSREENDWYRNKARFDAETFLYRGNGSLEVISDTEFSPGKYADRNVIIYGNSSNNKAWRILLSHAPIQVDQHQIRFGDVSFRGDDLAVNFIYPRRDSQVASVGVVAGTGIRGMKATQGNSYFSGITGFPDVLIFKTDMLKDGLSGVMVSGFFGNDWSVEKGDFAITW